MSRIDPIELFITELARGARQQANRQKRQPERAAQAEHGPSPEQVRERPAQHAAERQ
jgi:hypothetical protein